MTGRVPSPPPALTAFLERLPLALRSRAEVNHDLDFRHASVNLFAVDRDDVATLATFVPDADWPNQDARMRAHFRVQPRRWVKVTPGRPERLDAYYQLVDGDLAALRLFLAAHDGQAGIPVVEAGLGPLVGRDDVDWGLVVKRDGRTVRPRIAVRLPTALLADVLARWTDVAYLTPATATALRHAATALACRDAVYVSVDPLDRDAVALDVPTPGPISRWLGDGAAWLDDATLHFAKVRFPRGPHAPPAVTVYRPAGETMPTPDVATHVERVRSYYDATTDVIEATYGATYQAALYGPTDVGTYDATASTLGLLGRMEIADAPLRLLDLGCGLAGPAIDVARAYPHVHVVGVNLSPVQVARARARVEGAGLADRIEIVEGDFHDLAFADDAFDGAYAFEALAYAFDLPRVASEIARVVRPGGWLYLKEIVRASGPLDARQREHLARHDHTYALRTPTGDALVRACERAGLDVAHVASLDDVTDTDAYQRKMFALPRDADLRLFQGFRPPLSPFGRRHHHEHAAPPLSCLEVRAHVPPPPSPDVVTTAGAPRDRSA
ncbi:MAG: class I SAM-dependent methyltransferase [Trueperaceae bacterium]|nr:class I SAM-dependent methyltransferase [Trueperaceae bacterium]